MMPTCSYTFRLHSKGVIGRRKKEPCVPGLKKIKIAKCMLNTLVLKVLQQKLYQSTAAYFVIPREKLCRRPWFKGFKIMTLGF